MKRNTYKILTLAACSALVLASCKKQLDIPSRNSLDANVALTTKSGIENSINSIYSILKREKYQNHKT